MIQRIGDTATTPEQAKWRSKLISLTVDYTNTFDVAAKLVQENKLTSADLDKNMEYLYNESQKLMADIFINVDQFYVAYSQDAEAAVAATQKLLNRTVAIMLSASLIVVASGAVIAYMLIRSFVKPIQKLQQAVRFMSEGDLRFKINSRSKDELGVLSSSFDHMIDQVSNMLAHTQTIASSLSAHSKTFHRFSSTTAAANADIVRAIQEISTGSDQQALHSEKSTLLIAELEGEIETISGYTQTVQQKSREAAVNTYTGSTSMEALKEASASSREVLNKVVEAMESLSASSSQIGKIVNTITEISQQTNVLALNASIEAARAGAHGRGFSVIAEEVRQLSNQTQQSSQLISSIIHSLQKQTKELESYLGEARTSFDRQNDKMDESLDAFQQIHGSMDQLSEHISNIHQQIASAKAKNQMLVESVQYVSAIAEETAAGVEAVNSTSVQQDAAIHQIAAQADDILDLSDRLFSEINQFQIGEIEQVSIELSEGWGVTAEPAQIESVPAAAAGLSTDSGKTVNQGHKQASLDGVGAFAETTEKEGKVKQLMPVQ
jgi:methyl-accepting chemotaxis protein